MWAYLSFDAMFSSEKKNTKFCQHMSTKQTFEVILFKNYIVMIKNNGWFEAKFLEANDTYIRVNYKQKYDFT